MEKICKKMFEHKRNFRLKNKKLFLCIVKCRRARKPRNYHFFVLKFATLTFVGGKSAKSTLKSDRRRSARRSVSFCSPLPEKDKSSSLRQPPTPHRSLGKQTQNYISLVSKWTGSVFFLRTKWEAAPWCLEWGMMIFIVLVEVYMFNITKYIGASVILILFG